jgi:hypothetical protein
MIITRIVGGLGNQLFCYAAGKSLADRHHVPLHLDISAYDSYTLHPYRLNQFKINAEPTKSINRKRSLLKKVLPYLPKMTTPDLFTFAEKSLEFDETFLTLSDQTYLSGYWQSEKYFSNIIKNLREELQFKQSPDQMNAEYLACIQSSFAVSVHIRRGDYVTNPEANAVHGTCDLEYYRRATALLHSKLNHTPVTYYIFSDDPEWVQSHLRLNGDMVFITHNNGIQNHEDLRLMSACQHHIIANSTFSWWGAWLNPSPKKMVIAPKQWFKDSSYSCRDLVPESWISV